MNRIDVLIYETDTSITPENWRELVLADLEELGITDPVEVDAEKCGGCIAAYWVRLSGLSREEVTKMEMAELEGGLNFKIFRTEWPGRQYQPAPV